MRNLTKIALVAAALLTAGSASAQYYSPGPYGPYDGGYGRDRGYDRGYDDRRGGGWDRGYDRRGGYDNGYGNRGGWDNRRGGGRNASICVTGRGSCAVPAAPAGISCRCDIDGLTKRGITQ